MGILTEDAHEDPLKFAQKRKPGFKVKEYCLPHPANYGL